MACSQNTLPCPVLFFSSFPERTDTCGVLGFSPSRRDRFMLPTKLRPREGTKWLVYTSQEENLIPFSEHRVGLDNGAETGEDTLALIRWQWRQEVLLVILNLRGTWVNKHYKYLRKDLSKMQMYINRHRLCARMCRTVDCFILIFIFVLQ